MHAVCVCTHSNQGLQWMFSGLLKLTSKTFTFQFIVSGTGAPGWSK